MSKKTRAPTRKKRPIADSLRTSFRTLLDRQIIDLGAVREGRANAERLLATRPRLDGELDPSHAAYIEMLNLLSVLCEQLTSLEELGRHAAVIIKAEDEYVPGWPPMSPISTSHFNTWSMLDLAIGVERETIASIVVDLGDVLGLGEGVLQIMRKLADSRLGLYVHEGAAGDRVVLRELVTERRVHAICSSGHTGTAGEQWLVRLLPPPVPEVEHHAAFTSPYVIELPRDAAWLAYFRRTLPKTRVADDVKAYEILMKYGLGFNYWNEYIFEAYWSHTDGMIGLLGLPDLPESRPQSHEVEGDTGKIAKYYGMVPRDP